MLTIAYIHVFICITDTGDLNMQFKYYLSTEIMATVHINEVMALCINVLCKAVLLFVRLL